VWGGGGGGGSLTKVGYLAFPTDEIGTDELWVYVDVVSVGNENS
jgi:hypothetical protein